MAVWDAVEAETCEHFAGPLQSIGKKRLGHYTRFLAGRFHGSEQV